MAAKRKSKKDDLLPAALEMYRQGAPITRIAEHLNVNRRTVRRWLDDAEASPSDKHELRAKEEEQIWEVAQSMPSDAEAYQSYMASMGARMMRDARDAIRPPKTIRELEQLDRIIRRNLGIDAKGNGGGSRVQIDVSILNNAKRH